MSISAALRSAPRPALAGFAIASLVPMGLLALGGLLGGIWIWAALCHVTLFVAIADRLAPPADFRDGAPAEFPAEIPAGDALLVVLALSHLGLLALAVWAIGGPGPMSAADRIAAFFAFGLAFGQISNAVAHELIHRHSSGLRRLGTLVYITLLFGHHASAHRHVHHRHVATPADPNTARRGESFYAFAPRAWAGSFRAGLAAEAARHRPGPHPYVVYVAGGGLCALTAFAGAGAGGLAAYLGLAGYATALLLLSDYVQHYGLSRARRPDGTWEPVSDHHSWNAPQRPSGAMLLNAPRHSDHHAHPARPYPALDLPEGAPLLPRGLPVMGALALVPPMWRRVMHPRLDRLARGSRESDGPGAGAAAVDLAT